MSGGLFQFYSPEALLLLIFAPLIWFFDHKKLRLVRFSLSSKRVVEGLTQKTLRQNLEFVPGLIKTLSFVFLVIALARPQYVNELTQVKSEGIDIVLALDTSLSMQALDMNLDSQNVTRLQAAKAVIADFVKGRQYDRIGMVVFGEQAYTQVPLTLDYDMLTGFLGLIEAGIAGNGTAIGNSLATSVKRLMKSEAESRVIILLTDGKNQGGEISPLVAADLAKEHGIKVYTIGLGSNRKYVPVLLKDTYGRMYKDVINLGGVDAELLSQIAITTGGQYFRAQTGEILQEVYAKIDTLEKTEVEIKHFQEYDERFVIYLLAAFVLYLLHWLLRQTYFFRIP